MPKTLLDIHGMHCASCANTVQGFLEKQAGIHSATVHYASATAEVSHTPRVSEEDLVALVAKTGYSASIHDPTKPKGAHDHVDHADMKHHDPGKMQGHDHMHEHAGAESAMWLAAGAALPLLILSLLPLFGVPVPHVLAIGIVELVLAATAIWAGRDIYRQGVLGALRMKSANMDTLIALGSAVSFLYSVYGLLTGGAWYFDSTALIIAFILVGRYLEAKARGTTKGQLDALLHLAPEKARRMDGKKETEVLVSDIKEGDILKVKPGDRIPVDGIITVGSTRINESMLTGESVPVKRTIHEEVFAGTLNKTGMFLMRATNVGSDTAASRIVRLVEEAQRSKAPVQRLADRVAAVFVPAVIGLAVLTFLLWLLAFNVPLSFAVMLGVSVLVISCPCALGLATPVAIMVSTGSAAKKGVLFRNAVAIQKAADVRMVAFDKTGTLTKGEPSVVFVRTYHQLGEAAVFRYAASLESGSEHPLAQAIVQYAELKNIGYGDPRDFTNVEGKGVRGKVQGRKVLVGSLDFIKEEGVGIYDLRERIPALTDKGYTPVVVAVDGSLAALIGVADPVKPSAKDGIKALSSARIQTVMLTGDNEQTAAAVAKTLGVSVVRAKLSPKDKLDELRKLQKRRAVAMVGDGVNDAPALAQADVGIALGGGTDAAREAGEVVLVRDDIRDVPSALSHARRTMMIVKQNLGWAFGYNIIAIPLAAGVLYPSIGLLLSPGVAAAAMAFSSLSVVLNSLRLR